MHNKISFTTTALVRPEIIEKTYASFSKNLVGIDLSKCTLYINIDPIPNNANPMPVIKIARKFFGEVCVRIPMSPNFSSAVNWCWESANTPYIFHLEDDWLLLKEIDIQKTIKLFDKGALEVVFKAYAYEYDRLVLSPAIWKRDLYKTFAGKLDININPEIQLRNKKFAATFGISNIKSVGKRPIVRDIGREWLVGRNLKKPVKKEFVRY